MRFLGGPTADTLQLSQDSTISKSSGKGHLGYLGRVLFGFKTRYQTVFLCVPLLLLLHNFQTVGAFRPDPLNYSFRGQGTLPRNQHFVTTGLYPQPLYYKTESVVELLPTEAFIEETQGGSEENLLIAEGDETSSTRRTNITDRLRSTLGRASRAFASNARRIGRHISRGVLSSVGVIGGWSSLPKDTYEALIREKALLEQEGRLARLIRMLGLGKSLRNDVKLLKNLAQKIHQWNVGRQLQMETSERPKTKLIIAVRHAESVFNKWRRESFTHLRFSQMIRRDEGKQDVELSSHGIKQCKHANGRLAFLLHEIRNLESKYVKSRSSLEAGPMFSPFCTDIFLVSPMTRTLQTASLVFEDLYSKLRCQPVSEVDTVGSKSEGTGAFKKEEHQSTGYWIVDALLRERISTNGDIGTEVSQLSALLPSFYGEQKMGKAFVDFQLIPEGSKWWIPLTREHMMEMIEDIRERKMKAETREEGTTDADDEETVASERDRGAETRFENVVAVGLEGEPLPQLSPVVGDVVAALKYGEHKGFDPKVEMEKLQLWNEASKRLRFTQTVPPEGNALVRLRAKVWLMSLCLANSANVVAVVTHSMFLKALTNDSKFSNAEIRAYTVDCENYTVKRL